MPETTQLQPAAATMSQSTMEWLGHATLVGTALWGVFSVMSWPVTIAFGLGIAAGNQTCREKFVEGACLVAKKTVKKATEAAFSAKVLAERRIALYHKNQEYRNYDPEIPDMEESEVRKLSNKSRPLVESWVKLSFV